MKARTTITKKTRRMTISDFEMVDVTCHGSGLRSGTGGTRLSDPDPGCHSVGLVAQHVAVQHPGPRIVECHENASLLARVEKGRVAEGAKRIPIEALNQARERPVRTFYALSLPLGLAIVMLNSNVVGAVLSYIPGPFKSAAGYLHDVMAVNFAPEREGLKWIEVTNPRSRRTDRMSPPAGN